MKRFIVRVTMHGDIPQESIEDRETAILHGIHGTGSHRNGYTPKDWRDVASWMNERAKALT